MTDPRYIYHVNGSEATLSVSIAIYNEETGHATFARDADVYVNNWGRETPEVSINQGSQGVSIEDAKLKQDVYGQAIMLGQFIKDSLDNGETMLTIGKWLIENLPTQVPVSTGFSYTGVKVAS